MTCNPDGPCPVRHVRHAGFSRSRPRCRRSLSGDDERAIDRVPAYADGREKTDENYHQFAERITKARKKEAAPWQKPWKLSDSPIWRLPAQRARVGEWVDEPVPGIRGDRFSATRTR